MRPWPLIFSATKIVFLQSIATNMEDQSTSAVFRALVGSCVLVANRGECACRIIKSCRKLGIATSAVYTDPDRTSLHTRLASRAVRVQSYLDAAELIQVALDTEATAIHPGWGFLSENPEFAKACCSKGITFIGPTAANMSALGHKTGARNLAQELHIPVVPGSPILQDVEEAISIASSIGYPVVLKAANGGGGIGIYRCNNEMEVRKQYQIAKTQVLKAFGDSRLFLEKCIEEARHVEVQVFGNGEGHVVILGERECSVQRRYQKIMEETPAPGLSAESRYHVHEAAHTLTKAVQYRSAGTAEFLMDKSTNMFYFMEFNTRLQVEHGVTELYYGVDLVAWMVCLAYGCLEDVLGMSLNAWTPNANGHAMQVRVYAEDPVKNFQPSPGVITSVDIPIETGTRVDIGVYQGYELPPFYDSMIAKVLQWAPTRLECIDALRRILTKSQITGPANNVAYINQFLDTAMFRAGDLSTSMLSEFKFSARCIEVLSAGMMTMIQDWPGRVKQGLWRVGVPPSGAMDHLACRLGNTLVGNREEAAVLEMCISGPTLKFHSECLVAITGAPMEVRVNGKLQPQWASFMVRPGTIISIMHGSTSMVGCRVYLSVAGGIDVPEYLGSRATFTSGQFGGYQGRLLQAGDMLPIGKPKGLQSPKTLAENLIPTYTNKWHIGCLPGPYTDPDYMTPDDIRMFHSTEWKVHHDSNRLGIRLLGPTPTWAREHGGDGGSHPSNVHDYVYGVGSVNFTGNMPIIITHDGPSLGGFVCPVTVVQSELWKVGQLLPGDTVQFVRMDIDEANEARLAQKHFIATLQKVPKKFLHENLWSPRETKAVLLRRSPDDHHPGMELRLIGDTYIMVEYGAMVLDLNLRFRAHFLEQKLLEANIQGLQETAPGVRSLQVHYDPDKLPLQKLVNIVSTVDSQLPDVASTNLSVRSRILHLPLCFNHSGVNGAIQRYIQTVRKEAPYLPSNIDFIAENNGLSGAEEVYEKVFSASYMCLGLGDVYLNSPCAVPINPLHRLITPKYNPARTYTQEGTVGLGGAYMCIYAMASPGGYQLVGRTLPIWNTYGTGNRQNMFSRHKPWLFEMFDQIRFFPVSEKQLEQMRWEFRNEKLDVKIEEADFNVKKYHDELVNHKGEITNYQSRQREAAGRMNMKEEKSLARLKELDQVQNENCQDNRNISIGDELEKGQVGVYADMPAMVGEVCVKAGDEVSVGDTLLLLFSMKVENSVCSTMTGRVQRVLAKLGDITKSGDLLAVLEP